MPQTQVPHILPCGIMWSRSGSGGGGRGGGSHSFIKHQCKLTTQLQTSTGPHCEKSINHRVGPDSIDSIAQFHVDINEIPLGSAVLDGLDTNKGFINDQQIHMILMFHGLDTIYWINYLEEHLLVCHIICLVLHLLIMQLQILVMIIIIKYLEYLSNTFRNKPSSQQLKKLSINGRNCPSEDGLKKMKRHVMNTCQRNISPAYLNVISHIASSDVHQ